MNNEEIKYFNLSLANLTKIKEYFGDEIDELALNNEILNNISKLSKSKFKIHFYQFLINNLIFF
jgi:hypothetical protein